MNKLAKTLTLLLLLLGMSMASQAEENAIADKAAQASELEVELQDLKKEVLDLNRDLFLLEEDLLFPANTQFNVYLSVDVGTFFALDSVQLKVDDKVVANHLYTEREAAALNRGGVQRLYVGNLSTGKHEVVAFFVGKGPNDRDYRRGTSVQIEKTSEPLFVELKIVDNASKEQPEFVSRVWE